MREPRKFGTNVVDKLNLYSFEGENACVAYRVLLRVVQWIVTLCFAVHVDDVAGNNLKNFATAFFDIAAEQLQSKLTITEDLQDFKEVKESLQKEQPTIEYPKRQKI
mmetsp:Transcript_64475/g.170732  ORF Transcript_64475/g.170732 Transcript_64475/m.170732 type:complete len:107 (+) Transcript_64475:774-1094(+)